MVYKYDAIFKHELKIDMNDTIANHRFNFRVIMIFEFDEQHYIDFLKKLFKFEISFHVDNVLKINFDVDYVLKK